MKNILYTAILLATAFTTQAQYKLEFNIKNLPDTSVQLLRYLGDKFYYVDTTESKNGKAVFEKDYYEGGVYAFYTGKGYFEFIMSDKNVVIETTNGNFIPDMKIKKSDENKVFYAYINFINEKRMAGEGLRAEIEKLDEDLDKNKIEILREKLQGYDKEVKAYQQNLVKEHDGKLIAKILKMSIDIKIPEELNDTLKGAYLRDHYWENVDITDKRLARTPVFKQKLETYFKTMMHQIPDTILEHAYKMVDQIEDSSDMMKLVLNYIHITYETSNIMGMDRVYVGMSEKYYCDSTNVKAFWYPEQNLIDRCERAKKLKPLLMGEKAPNIRLPDSTEKNWIDIDKLDKDYKVLVFWDPDCGHCKKEIPKLLEVYHELQEKNQSVEFIGIGTNMENEKWKKTIVDKKIDWINVSDFPEANKNAGKYIYEQQVTDFPSLNFRKTYDIFSTPQIYLLDKDGIIVGKRLDANNLARILERKLDIEISYKVEEKKEDNKGEEIDLEEEKQDKSH